MTRAKQNVITDKHRAHLYGGTVEAEPDAQTMVAIDSARDATEARKSEPSQYVLREAEGSDDHYILDNWTRSYLYSDITKPVPRDVFNVEQRARIARILRYAKLMCAVDPYDATRIKGWICFQAAISDKHWVTVHYVCVHPSLQNKGIGKRLIDVARLLSNQPQDPLWITHWTLPMRRIADRWNLIYNPYLLEVLHAYD